MDFQKLGLMDPIVKALKQAGYTAPTPIQEKAIPPALAGRDVLGCAQTGTGKTCAFAAPILQRLSGSIPKPRVIRALILTPTRELAIQIGESFTAYGQNLSLRHSVIFGGVGQQPQVDAIRKGLDILVATPGRLLDLQVQGLLDLSHIEIFVLDEADRMLDMGFIHDVKRVLKLLPKQKQTLFFSATMPPEVMELVNSLLHNYARVEVDPVSSPVEVIRQSLYFVDKGNKTKLLAHLIRTMDIPAALVFSRTKHGANRIAQDLNKDGITAAAIHGNKSQTARVQALNDFKAGRIRVLVATDIAARGIDIEELGCVFNYNLPDVPETYVHRIGRTGRAGRGGMAISFCQFDEQGDLKAIQKLLGRPIPVVEEHPYPMVVLEAAKKDKNGRPVNAEDAEARAAAKERRRQRDAENKARAEAKKAAAARKQEKEDKVPAPVEAPVEAPAGNKRKGKKKPAAAAPAAETAPVPTEPVPKAASNRGVRHGRLQDTAPADPSMPVVDFYKPNPLDSDVIMDATARLLAPRKPVRPAAPVPARPKAEKPKKQSGTQAAKPEKQAAKPEKQGKKPRKKAKQPKADAGAEQAAAVLKKKRRRRDDRPRPMEAPLRSDRQKDSTEHKSLMKPYYMNHEED
ncbi:MAG: DEAD/DEAH box helicase [Oscillospiraceae bacterium]|nr:DEAD/DEAH box helicase [Oscillospiraceae bacterium]